MRSSRHMSPPKKWLLFVNFLSAISGVLLLALSIFGMISQNGNPSAGDSSNASFYTTSVPTYIMILSALLLITSFIGFTGTLKDNPTALKVFFTMSILVFVLQVLLGSVALARENQVGSMIYDTWREAYDHRPDDIERIERAYQCCGFSSLLDRQVPDDCSLNPKFGYAESCREKLVSSGTSMLRGLGLSLLFIAALEIISLFLAMYTFYSHNLLELEYDMPHTSHEARTLIHETVGTKAGQPGPSAPGYEPITRV